MNGILLFGTEKHVESYVIHDSLFHIILCSSLFHIPNRTYLLQNDEGKIILSFTSSAHVRLGEHQFKLTFLRTILLLAQRVTGSFFLSFILSHPPTYDCFVCSLSLSHLLL